MGKKPTRETLGSGIDAETESTMYIDYPPTKPFVNDEYERPPFKPVSPFPEGNRKGRTVQMTFEINWAKSEIICIEH